MNGISKSAVSERFVYGTERKLAELMSRELSWLSLAELLIDGVHFGEHVVLAAVGVDEAKSTCWDCARARPRTPTAVRALLADLVESGLNCETLVISRDRRLQGAAQGSGRGVGAYTLIQRYREHKKRNVAEALPQRL